MEEFRVSVGVELNEASLGNLKSQIQGIKLNPIKIDVQDGNLKSEINSIKSDIQSVGNVKVNFNGFSSVESSAQSAQQKVDTFRAKMQERIQFKVDTGDFETRFNLIDSKFKSLDETSDKLQSNMKNLKSAFDTLQDKDKSIDEKIAAYEKFNALLPVVKTQINDVAKAQQTLTKSQKLSNDISAYSWYER